MDDIYQNNEDCPIKCNVVSNQLNFLNSIIYRDKVDFNNSISENDKLAEGVTGRRSRLIKAKSTIHK